MMRIMINTSEEMRKMFDDGVNCVISLETPEGYPLLGGTFSQRSWLAGDKSQGLGVPKRNKVTRQELEEIKEWEGMIYIFEDTLYLISMHESLTNIKYPLELLPIFEKAGIQTEDLR